MRNNRSFPDLSLVFCDDLLVHDAEMFYRANGKIFEYARELRKRETKAEKLLWMKLQRKQIDGFRFRRQHPIGNYVADFYCHEARLVVEVDGAIHDQPEQFERDRERSSYMTSEGISTLRFTNRQVELEIENVIHVVRNALKSPFRGFRGCDTPCH